MILNLIRKTIDRHSLIEKGDSVLVALSGGADSVCLTHALSSVKDELGIKLHTAHVNHGIRGAEAKRDEEFAKRFSSSLGIECHVLHADIPAIAKEKGISDETAGREIRYDYFKKLCETFGIDKIATAHNKNDNAETLLMNFMRGSSVNGLSGIPHKRDNIIRPILDISRAEIEKYCAENNLEYVTDSTNNELLYTRNKIRHILMPLIEKEFNASFINTVTDNAALIFDDSAYIEKKAFEAYSELVSGQKVSVSGLESLAPSLRRRVIREMIKHARNGLEDIPSFYVDDILSLATKNSGASINLSDGIVARTEYGSLIIEKKSDASNPFEYEFDIISEGYIPEISKKIIIAETDVRKNDGAVYLDTAGAKKITVRSRREGDIFYPSGMTGSKKIKEYFINEKIPRNRRATVPIIEINGDIAAVGGRVDRRFLFKNKGIRIKFISMEESD